MKTLISISLLCLCIVANAETFIVKTKDSSNGQSMTFEPPYIKIKVGDEVLFKPEDKGHNSQAVYTPEGANKWKGQVSKEIKVKFEVEGIYLYECMNHAVMGMAGIVEVGKPVNKKEAQEFFAKYKKKMVMNKTRLDGHLQ